MNSNLGTLLTQNQNEKAKSISKKNRIESIVELLLKIETRLTSK